VNQESLLLKSETSKKVSLAGRGGQEHMGRSLVSNSVGFEPTDDCKGLVKQRAGTLERTLGNDDPARTKQIECKSEVVLRRREVLNDVTEMYDGETAGRKRATTERASHRQTSRRSDPRRDRFIVLQPARVPSQFLHSQEQLARSAPEVQECLNRKVAEHVEHALWLLRILDFVWR